VVVAATPPTIAATALIGGVPLALAAIVALALGIETRGRRLEQIAREQLQAATPAAAATP
jgi:hypothetical protein